MASKNNSIILFQKKQVRRSWNEKNELWYFSIVDIIAILTASKNPNNYWKVLKHRLKKEGNESVTNCNQLKLLASDGKKYMTDVADTETLFRLIQSIPSPKAEPFKLWLARVGYERIEETEDPELAIDRAMQTYLKKGYSKNWINQRLKTIEIRKELTDEWQERGVKEGLGFAILTNEITKAWAGKSIKSYKACSLHKTQSNYKIKAQKNYNNFNNKNVHKINLKNVVWQEGEYYISQCLDVDISSFGKTKEESLKMIEEALELYFEDAPLSYVEPN